MSVTYSFDSKVALVTGATSGIGRETTLLLSRCGASVLACGRRADLGDQLVRDAEAAGKQDGRCGPVRFVVTDVTDGRQVQAAVQSTLDTFGCLDAAFNNAGTMGRGRVPLIDTDEEDFATLVDTNLKGCWNSLRHEIGAMRERGGSIVNCASVTGLVAFPGVPLYTATKHAVVGLTKAAALEHAADGIRVNAVCPSAVDTALLRTLPDELLDAAIRVHPLGRMVTLAEVADLVAYLLSDAAAFITGAAYALDGGFSAG
jgi:NAD(P)-dependent dehydrogenase (short-subunit alcohol dehydrogenase family)